MRPAETVLNVCGEALEQRVEGLAAACEVADESLKAVLPLFEGEIERLLLRGEILRDGGKRVRVLGEPRR